MIGRLRGKIHFITDDQLLVDVQGVGYLVNVPTSTASLLTDGKEAVLLISTHVREDAIVLYGFATDREKELFELLNTVSGVGPKLALSVLSTLSPDNFCQAILEGNLQCLTKVPGIGKRTGERLVVELKDKVARSYTSIGVSPGISSGLSQAVSEAIEALLALGYSASEAEAAVANLQLDGTESTEAIIKRALGFLVKTGNV
ncbi:MAG: Holliday junction branch migration protein RuvA [Firmicutes bacterium]|nr:Holliday junction branch migration protein RuvA [Bacillota bacterium]